MKQAYLLPKSPSAKYSLRLPENVNSIRDFRAPRLPTPDNEDLESALDGVPSGVDLSSRDCHSFDLGSGIQNYFILKHHPDLKIQTCYINHLHCQFFWNPDSTELWLRNKSTSEHTVQKLHDGAPMTSCPRDYSIAMTEGKWDVCLGLGLEFICVVVSSLSAGTALSIEADSRRTTKSTTNSRKKSTTRTSTTIAPPAIEESIEIVSTVKSTLKIKTLNGKTIAIKMCRAPDIPGAADRWRREVNIMKILGRHDNIVELFGSDARSREIRMQLITGRSLDNFVKDTHCTLSTDHQLRLYHGVAAGLAWIHSREVLYNDLKPGNTMYDPETRNATLVDFGTSNERLEGHFMGGGTPWYLPPEYIVRRRGFAGDVWALGIMMLFCIGVMPLPELTERAWKISNVYERTEHQRQMITWLRKVREWKQQIPSDWGFVAGLLESNELKRTPSDVLVRTARKMTLR